MLSLFTLKKRLYNTPNSFITKQSMKKTSKHFPSPLREWNNSIYVYNKNSVNNLPSTANLVNALIKKYFNFYNKRLELKMRSKRLLLRLRKFSCNKFFVSSGGFKHTNNKVYINLYVYNRQKINYYLTLKKWFLKTVLSKSIKTNSSINLIKRINFINKKGIENLISINKQKYLLIKTLNTINFNKNKVGDINSFKDIIIHTEDFYKKLIKKSLKKIRMYFYYKQLIYLNKSKLNYTYLQYLSKYLEKLYNKNVEFNIINIKKFYLDSHILSESLALKISKNRRIIIKILNTLKNKIAIKRKVNESDNIYNVSYALPLKNNVSNNKIILQKFIVDNLKYKHLAGFRLEAKGRLAKRASASRSMSKLVYKGNLLDIDSSYKGLSSVLLKGNLRPNAQFTSLKSKSRLGSFGIKGWISGN